MGVDGLWKLIDQGHCGGPISLESLENAILAIGMHQFEDQKLANLRSNNNNKV